MESKNNGTGFNMLKQNKGSPSKRQFNPHPPEAPPQLKEPKRLPKKIMSFSPKKKEVKEDTDYSQFDIEQLLADEGIEFRNPEKAPGGWLPLEAYDDEGFDTRTPSGWLRNKVEGKYVKAKGLWKDRDALCYWREIHITRYFPRSRRYEGTFKHINQKAKLPRIYVLFDEEDPRHFVKRFKHAYQTRIHADSLIRYNYYIENMPIHEIPELDHEKINRILILTQNTKALRGKSSADTSLLNEINFDFAKTMNKIIFDKHLKEKGSSGLITGSLSLPADKPKGLSPYFGMISIPPHDYPGTFARFDAATLLKTKEVVIALQEIKKECNDVMTRDIYNPNINKTMGIEDFKQIQNSSISQTSYYLRETWVNKIKDIIKGHFNNLEGGWFNLNETNKDFYEVGNLKKFLTEVKFVMQDTLLVLTRKSVKRFKDSILTFLPISCKVNDVNNITNKFMSDEEEAKLDDDPFASSKNPIPLFSIDLILEEGSTEPQYSVEPGDVVSNIMQIFDLGIEKLQEITQLEQKLMPHLFKKESSGMYLKASSRPRVEPPTPDPSDKRIMEDENLWVWDAYKTLRSELMKAIYPMDDFISSSYLSSLKSTEYKLNVDEYIRERDPPEEEGDGPEIEELKKDVESHLLQAQKLKNEIPDFAVVSMFQIDCRDFRDHLSGKHAKIAELEIEIIAKRAKKEAAAVLKKFEEMHARIERKPDDIEGLTAIKEYMEKCDSELEKLYVEIKECMKIYDILDNFQYKFDDEDVKKKFYMQKSPKITYELIDRQTLYLEKEKEKLINQMYGDQNNFKAEITQLETTISTLSQYNDINQSQEVAEIVRNTHEKMKKAHEKAKKFSNRERLTGLNETDYSNLQLLQKEYEPYYNLWTTTDDWFQNHESWLKDPWDELDAPDMEDKVTNYVKTVNKVNRYFREKDQLAILKIGEVVKTELDKFKPLVPLAIALRKQGMKDRHWEQLSEAVGFEVKPTEDFTFQRLIDMNLIDYVSIAEDIGEKAAKEYTIELELKKMKEEWLNIEFFLIPFKKSETYTVTGFDDALTCLDEQNVKTQAMQFSPFKKPFEEEIKEWYDLLLLMTDTLEEWIKCQGQWAYLQPIFDSPDIMKQLPAENKKFKAVDSKWRATMKKCKENPNVLSICEDPQLKEDFVQCNLDLDIVQKGLKDYLESKRSVFARFYFLSNDDLLLILSQTKDVQNVRPHLRKVFENLSDVHFNPDNTISAMLSSEKERIEFVHDVDPRDRGVEYWMGDVEDMMIQSVRHVLLRSIENYTEVPRTEWIKNHPGQCVLNGSQVHWTKEVEESFKQGPDGVKAYYDKLGKQLLDTVTLVRTKLSNLQSIALGALIVIDVHAKDVVETLVQEKVDDENAFEWISQLRYYWEDDECRVKMVQTNFPYGYEYLGNTLRLVITPLTDKCYITLMGALKLNLGGAPAGPAGTGKTESTKDLAKALAKQCVVFNCSDGMDYLMVGKFFKGLASAGAWCCFDEFNRINIEVLSVIAQQLLTLFDAKATGVPELIFEESRIVMKPTFCVFITMNPGYAGRTELPDNLKALFRPMAMMVPDYALIGQIMLYSFGFSEAKVLAEKMVTTFKLSSEQLSSQCHYDYGMRAVRSVINAAGRLKREEPDMDEDKLLLRALRDVNVPKFLKDDLPLFENIINDLFPGVERPQINYGNLVSQMYKSCEVFNLQPEKVFIEKVIQLYDTILVRHGLMLVGPTGGGKTCNYRVLQHTMSELAGEDGFEKVNTHILNPKSITMGQLYGEVDPQTTEWIDGVLAKKIEICAADQSPERHWVMFDGPVDALWIESMNTVLDDNKKLCLNSGQIIPLTDMMTMMFEVEDLEVASPATVSRCGMVYMEPVALGFKCIFESWFNTFPPPFRLSDKLVPKIKDYVAKYNEEVLTFVRKNLYEPVVTMDNNLCQSFCRILDCYFADYYDNEAKVITKEEIDDFEDSIEALFCYALIWSYGCTTDFEGRKKFDVKVREILKGFNGLPPNTGLLHDFCYDTKTKMWVDWLETVPAYAIDTRLNYTDIVVPTFDSIRMKYLKKLLISNKKHVLCPGNTGTGKTINIEELLTKEMPEEYQSLVITFSAQTSANQTQDALDEKFEKRARGVFGPAPGKRFVIFVDDLNMPKKEEYGAQPPIEFLRQWLDHGGWYDRESKEKSFRKVEDIILVSAMGPPGGGRSHITARMMRHFNIITYTNLQETSIKQIFATIVKGFLADFTDEVKNSINTVVEMTLSIYNNVATELKPTPTKSHYTFNLRDIAKIFQGVCSANSKSVTKVPDIVKLWAHENYRVFRDRMVSEEDRTKLNQLINKEFTEKLNLTEEQIHGDGRIIFGDYMYGIDVEPRNYEIITDIDKMIQKMVEYLNEYNEGVKHPMKLVMFLDACDHVSRISRILRQPKGHALLLGVGGSGRQSLSKLATYISNYMIYQIEVSKGFNMNMWRDNLRECLKQCGVQGKPTTFLFCDTQIIDEQMLEDINNVLNSGDVPGLYKPEDMEDINEIGKTECLRKNLPLSKMNMFSCYLARVKSNIHVVLAMSPLGEVFRTRLRKFPSLVNCCTIDWFTNWPEEALLDVARGALQDNDLGIEKYFDGVTEMFKIIHQSVEKISEKFLDQLRRHNYVTPTSYLELLNCYQNVLKERLDYFGGQKSRLERGLSVLAEAAVEIANLREMLDKKQPELEATKIEVAKTKETIAKESEAAEETRVVVAADEAAAAVQESEVSAINKSALDDLAEAEPALEEATKQLKALDVNDFYELKSMGVPTPAVVKMFEITCIMMKKPKPKKPTDPKKAESDPDGYFELAKKSLLNNPKEFLTSMLTFEKDNIPDALVAKVKPLLQKEEVKIENVRKASKALVAVHTWCNAMIKYHEVLKIVNPKRELAREMGEKLEKVRAELNEKRAILKAVNDKIAMLEAEFARMIQKEKDLNQEITDCKKKLERAEKLISGLEGEKVRWIDTVKQLGERRELLVGDCLIAAGMVSYSGPFTMEFRQELEKLWNDNVARLKILHTPNIRMSKVLGDDVTIRIWNVAGLPNDDLSVENGIIMFKSRRWPLMIDPQTQAKKFIKNLGKDREPPLEAFKPSEPNILRGLELAIQFGRWILLENVGEELDPALEPILLQQKIKTGSSYTIKIGDKTITYNEDFKFYMTTTLPNPHYTPETSVKVTILNFAITPKGLEEQMLNQLVQLEMPELQEKKNQIVEDNARALKELRDIEDKILHGLTKNEQISQILEDDELIITLEASRKTSAEINQRMKESEITEKEIDEKRESYRAVAYRASLLFFCVTDLSTIDPMYQNSLQWFQSLFENGVRDSQPSADPQERTQILNDFFTLSLYENVCRGLFEEHKLLFSFLLTVKVLFGDNLIDPNEWRYFLAGPSGEVDIVPNPTDWLDELEWAETYKQINGMNELPAFRGIDEYFIEYHKRFKKIFDATEAHEEPLPGEWNDKLNSFQKMIVLKCIRPDKIVNAIQNFIVEKVGQKFIEPPTFDLKKSYRDSNHKMPLIFILSSGTDPVADFAKFAIEMGMNERKDTISLGQGMAKRAEKMIRDSQVNGKWCLLANCHLSISWMPSLERIVEQLNDEIHPDFRMWLTSMPTPKFPVSTLQNSVKMTLEPPQGLRANLRRSYTTLDDRELNDCNKPNEFKKLLFGFCFFHAIVQDRRKFGPIGWNIRYGFTTEDLTVCKRQLKIFLDEGETIPYKVLNYLGAQINYGGRVTDDKDKRLINTIMEQYICPEILQDGHKFSESGKYVSPKVGTQEHYLECISTLPLNPSPEVFGLHENAEITTQQAETRNMLSTILSVQPRASASGGKTRDQVLSELAVYLETKTPPPFPLEEVAQKYPTEYTESMNTVLTQEVLRYNKLLVVMADSLQALQKALVGEVVMSEELEKLSNSLFDNLVPVMWEDVGFLSLKPLASWIQDLNDRIKFLSDWIEGGTPAVFWISGFFFPQAFLTGTLQNYARKHIIAIDELSFQFKIYDDISPQDVKEKPEDGCYVYGMYLEGARWNSNSHLLDDSRPKQLYTELPMIWFLPKQNRKTPDTGVYNCPVYKVLSRAGTLSTTGHSTNYVLMLELPTKEKESKWIIAGVACFLALRY